jgi:diaminopimelate decarboxylase
VSSTWHGWQSEEVCVWHQARSSASINGLHGFTFSQIGSLLSADQILAAATKIGGKKWFSQLTTNKLEAGGG